MKKLYVLITLSFIFSLTVRATEFLLHRELIWNTASKVKLDNGEEIKLLSFSGAGIDNQTFLPVFYERVYVKNNAAELTVKLENAIYEVIPPIDIEGISNLTALFSEINFTTRISTARKSYFGNVSFIPIRRNQLNGQYERLVSFDLIIQQPEFVSTISKKKNKTYLNSSVLASGNWYKIAVAKEGIYKLTYADLQQMGMNVSSINPAHIRVYGNGGGMLTHTNSGFRYDDLQENAIYVSEGGDGKFDSGDYILFYAQSAHLWDYNSGDGRYHHSHHFFSDSTYYFITADLGNGKRISTQPTVGSANAISISYDDYAYHEREEYNMLRSGRLWYGEEFDAVTQYEITDFCFTNLDYAALAYAKIQVIAGATVSSSFSVNVAGVASTSISVSAISGNYYKDHAAASSKSLTFSPTSDSIPITISYTKSTSTAMGWLDYIEVNVRRNLVFSTHEQLLFRDIQSVATGQITNFQIADSSSSLAFVWEITDPFNIQQMLLSHSGTIANINVQTDSLRQFIAFCDQSVLSPTLIGSVPNQDLHAIGLDENGNAEKVDMVIVAYPDFLEQAERLAEFHEQEDSLVVEVVSTMEVYNEFSSGAQDVCAVRDFMKMLYDRADSIEIPSYLLLFGDGSYDPKNRVAGNSNYVMTFQNNSPFDPIKSYTSDDFFVLWDDDEGEWDYGDQGDLDAGVGRFPVKTALEAQIAVDKVMQYYNASTLGDWRNMICLIADDEDGNIHQDQAEALVNLVTSNHPPFNFDKIYFDAYDQTSDVAGIHYPDVTKAIDERVNKGALIVNYIGHGGENGLGHERVVEEPQIIKWNNLNNMPIFMTASCEVSRFDNPAFVSAGEHMFLSETGGGIALFSTVRVVYSTFNSILNQDFYKTVFERVNGKHASLGEIFMLSKNRSGVNDNSKNFTLLGDPALRLAIPEYNAITSTINGNNLSVSIDTLQALSKVTITGFIVDGNGTKLDSYNGILYPTVYDKAAKTPTLANDDDSNIDTILVQKSVLFKGKASIVNGDFTFSFMVPKDIALNYGYGKLSYYFENGEKDGNGYLDTVVIGGTNPNAATDTKGPEVKLYMEDENFVMGDATDDSPLLLAYVVDSNGVNTVGNGIGHDIVATLDGNSNEALVLNDYYEADLNSYQSGSIQYPYSELSTGRHSVELKVWDVYDNPSLVYTEFIVAETADIALKHVLNYPNPFTTHTEFMFEHNQPGIPITVQVQIFTVSGKLIKTIHVSMQTEDIQSEPIAWDGLDDYHNVIGKGVYIYRLTAETASSKAEQIEKLVVIR